MSLLRIEGKWHAYTKNGHFRVGRLVSFWGWGRHIEWHKFWLVRGDNGSVYDADDAYNYTTVRQDVIEKANQLNEPPKPYIRDTHWRRIA